MNILLGDGEGTKTNEEAEEVGGVRGGERETYSHAVRYQLVRSGCTND